MSEQTLLEACEEAIRFIDWIDAISKNGVEIYKHELRTEAARFRARIQPALSASPTAPVAATAEPNADLLMALQNVEMRTYWLVELRPAFDGHPSFAPTYYAGWMESPVEATKTTDVHASPKFTRKEDAQRVAKQLGHTLSCVWEAVEHGFYDRPAAANSGGQTGGDALKAMIDTKLSAVAALPGVSPALKTWPEEVFLSTGEDEELAPFGEYDDVSWCDHPTNSVDVRYVREDVAERAAAFKYADRPTATTAPAQNAATAQAAAATHEFVQSVPDHCDRIIWRDNYYHLLIPSAPAQDKTIPMLPRAIGVSRDMESPGEKSVLIAFERPLSDDELRHLHDALSQQAGTSAGEDGKRDEKKRFAADWAKFLRQAVEEVRSEGSPFIRLWDYEAALIANHLEARDASVAATPAQVTAVPEGFVLVPIEPTPEMMQAAWDKANELYNTPEGDDPLPGHQYRAMIATAPDQTGRGEG
jgi:hypothetical protein